MVITWLLLGAFAIAVLAYALRAHFSPADLEQLARAEVQRHAVRRARELCQFRFAIKSDAQRLRHELEDELREVDRNVSFTGE
jgi:hypothetical protein